MLSPSPPCVKRNRSVREMISGLVIPWEPRMVEPVGGTDILNQVSPHPRRVIPWSYVRSTPDSLRSPPRIPCPGADVRELLPLGELLTLCVWIVPAISAENHAVELPTASFRDLEER